MVCPLVDRYGSAAASDFLDHAAVSVHPVPASAHLVRRVVVHRFTRCLFAGYSATHQHSDANAVFYDPDFLPHFHCSRKTALDTGVQPALSDRGGNAQGAPLRAVARSRSLPDFVCFVFRRFPAGARLVHENQEGVCRCPLIKIYSPRSAPFNRGRR